MRQLLFKFLDKGIDWLFRPRTIAHALLKYGAIILAATLGLDIVAQLDFTNQAGSWRLRFATGDEGIPEWAILSAYIVSGLMIIFGLVVAAHRVWTDTKKERRQMLIVIELRGLHSSPDTPAKDANLGHFVGKRHWVLIDFRPQNEGDQVDPKLLLVKLNSIKGTVQTLSAGRDKSDIFIAVGGLAAVPALFLVGMLIDDESHTTIYDWDRNDKSWRLVDGADDGARFLPLAEPVGAGNISEVVLAVAVSYPIDEGALRQTFQSDIPVLRLTATQVLADRHWSVQKQQAMTVAFRDAVQTILARGVQKVHLVLAVPSSLAIRFGMAYDRRLMPDVVVYQYERSSSPPYPWGIAMPTHGRYEGTIVTRAAVQFNRKF